uniref:Uncharacterized protein n=1 Tax=Rhizophora mucronata TaxID=61149 RepID=A0A2P2IJR7_RHIMU
MANLLFSILVLSEMARLAYSLSFVSCFWF